MSEQANSAILEEDIRSISTRDLEVPKGKEGAYLKSLYENINQIYATHFPEVYKDPKLAGIKIGPPNLHKRITENGTEEIPLAGNGLYDPMDKKLELSYGVKDSSTLAPEDLILGIAPYPKEVKRKLFDIEVISHEMSHAIFDQITSFDSKVYFDSNVVSPETGNNLIDPALNEGFASLMELLMVDLVKRNPGLLDLSPADVETLEKESRKRMFDLAERDFGGTDISHYQEGLFKIMHNIYKESAGPPKSRNMNHGLKAVSEFIGKIDRNKSVRISRDNADYQAAIKTGNPQQLGRLIFKAAA